MNKLILGSILLVLIASGLSAQDKSGFLFSFHAGISSPLAPHNFSASYRSGANFGLGIGKAMSSNFILQGAINYHEFNFDGNGFQGTLENPDDVMTIEGGGKAIINLSGKAKFIYPHKPGAKSISYLFGGIGINRISEKQIVISRTEKDEIIPHHRETVIAAEAGLGINILIENSTLFFELGLNISFNEDKKIVFSPLRFGVAF